MTTADIHEPIRLNIDGPDPVSRTFGSRYDYPWGGDDGYDWMADANPRLGYREISSWGADGWDLGNWPYVIVSISSDGKTVLTYCEGDLTFEEFESKEDAMAKIDAIFLFHAQDFVLEPLVSEAGKVPERLDEVPTRFRGPYLPRRRS